MKSKTKLLTIMTIAVVMVMAFSAIVFAAIDESEPNDTFEQANPIYLNTTVYGDGYYYKPGETYSDHYSFICPISGTIRVDYYNDTYRIGYSYDRPEVTFYNEYCEKENRTYFQAGSLAKQSSYVSVKAGSKHYIRIANYERNYHFKLVYDIGQTSIKSVKAAKKAFTVNWNKKEKASFYQVRYIKASTYSDYGWSKAKVVDQISSSKKSLSIKKLSAKKKYYVQVRVARVIDGQTYYSGWCGKKTVTTK